MNKNAAILGMALFPATPQELAGIHAALVEGLRNGTLRPVIGQELRLAQASRAHEAVFVDAEDNVIYQSLTVCISSDEARLGPRPAR